MTLLGLPLVSFHAHTSDDRVVYALPSRMSVLRTAAKEVAHDDADVRVFRAPVVVSSAGAAKTFTELLGPEVRKQGGGEVTADESREGQGVARAGGGEATANASERGARQGCVVRDSGRSCSSSGSSGEGDNTALRTCPVPCRCRCRSVRTSCGRPASTPCLPSASSSASSRALPAWAMREETSGSTAALTMTRTRIRSVHSLKGVEQ